MTTPLSAQTPWCVLVVGQAWSWLWCRRCGCRVHGPIGQSFESFGLPRNSVGLTTLENFPKVHRSCWERAAVEVAR